MKIDINALKNISPRMAAQSVLVLSVAIGAGFILQKTANEQAAALAEMAAAEVVATDIVPLAAESAAKQTALGAPGAAVMGTPQSGEGVAQSADKGAEALLGKEKTQLAMTETTVSETEIPTMPLAVVPKAAMKTSPAILPTPNGAPDQVLEAQPVVPLSQTAQTDCSPSLDLLAEDFGMIGLTLIAGCDLNQRVVLRHGGLSVTGTTTATGALFASIPAMEKDAKVEVMFADGRKVESSISMPVMAELRRFAVQWQSDDAFQIHAFEGTVQYNTDGHISAASPHTPLLGQGTKGGFLTSLGDGSVELPMLAQVYTYPRDATSSPEVIVEAAVTMQTCGRDLLGETLTSTGGEVYITDLTVAMPDCAAVGDYLVLKNLVPELNITASN